MLTRLTGIRTPISPDKLTLFTICLQSDLNQTWREAFVIGELIGSHIQELFICTSSVIDPTLFNISLMEVNETALPTQDKGIVVFLLLRRLHREQH